MPNFMEKITLTQEEYDAIKTTLPKDTLIYITDNSSAPLAIGELTLETSGDGPTVLNETFITTTDESATLPNSIDLGSTLSNGQIGLLVNTVTAGEATITGAVMNPNTLVSVNGLNDVFSGNTLTLEGPLDISFPTGASLFTVTSNQSVLNGTLEVTGDVTIGGAPNTGGFTVTTPQNDVYFSVNGDTSDGFRVECVTSSSTLHVSDGETLLKGSTTVELEAETGITLTSTDGNILMPNLNVATGTALVWNTGGLITLATSSKRFKQDIQDIEFNTENIYKLAPKAFTYTESKDKTWGYIAEEVHEILPELVNYEQTETGEVPFSLAYDKLAIILVEELKKLRAEVNELKAK